MQRIGQVKTLGVDAPKAVDVLRQGNAGVGRLRPALHLLRRIFDQGLHRHRTIDQVVHEGGVGAVLQQSPDQVGQQILMLAHRGIDAAECAGIVHDQVVQLLPHAVQALKLKTFRPAAGHFQHRR